MLVPVCGAWRNPTLLSQQGVDLVLGVPESVLDLAALLMSDNRNAIIKVSAAIGFIVPSLQLWCLQYGMRRRSSSSLCCCATGPKLATGSVCPWLCSSDCDLTPTCFCVGVTVCTSGPLYWRWMRCKPEGRKCCAATVC